MADDKFFELLEPTRRTAVVNIDQHLSVLKTLAK